MKKVYFGVFHSVMLALTVCAICACGGTSPVVGQYKDFSGYVRDKNYSAAWSMLTERSQKQLGSQAKLQELCEGRLKKAFEK